MKKLLLIVLILSVSLFAQSRDRDEVSREIDLLNAMLELDGASWQAGFNEVALMDNEEMQGMLGLIEPEKDREEFKFDESQWPEKGKEIIVPNVTKVKNQKQCGSCVAFGTTAVFEQTYWKSKGDKKLFSERYLFFCDPYKGYGCNGGWSLDGGAVAASNSRKGMIEDGECPYFEKGQYYYDCGSGCNKNAQKYTMPYFSVNSNKYIDVLNSGKAIIMGMIVFEDFRYYKNGVYEHLQGNRLGGHCMALVGYGTTNKGEHYWVIKNSWSEDWGDKGYIKVRIKTEQQKKDSNVEDYGGYAFK
jgi:C1A family cysteine protease